MNKRQTGIDYEALAAAYLQNKGYRIIEKNYRCKAGEIDLIAEHEGYLCFIEVKYRKDDRFGSPAAAVDRAKQRTISRAARIYLAAHGYDQWTACRFDVAAIRGSSQDALQIQVIPNAFYYQP